MGTYLGKDKEAEKDLKGFMPSEAYANLSWIILHSHVISKGQGHLKDSKAPKGLKATFNRPSLTVRPALRDGPLRVSSARLRAFGGFFQKPSPN